MEIFETPLPGLGVRYEMTLAHGEHIAVVVLRDGRRELVRYDPDDPDTCSAVLELTQQESSSLVELLGGTKVTERLSDLRYEVEGLAMEWVTMPATGRLCGRTIADGAIRTTTGASVIAVIRGDTSIAGPGPDFRFEADDVVLVMGATQGVHQAAQLLST
jgi:TrkA domain protein